MKQSCWFVDIKFFYFKSIYDVTMKKVCNLKSIIFSRFRDFQKLPLANKSDGYVHVDLQTIREKLNGTAVIQNECLFKFLEGVFIGR